MSLMSHVGRLPLGWKKRQMSQWVPYYLIPALKSDLPHYSYIYRNPEPLGMEIKNLACSRLGTMLYLDIQKGREATKKAKFRLQNG